MRPVLLNPLFAPVTSLSGVGPKQDKLFRYLLGRDETPRLIDLLFHLPASVIDRRARPKIRDAVPGTVVTLEVTVDRHRPAPPGRSRAPHLVYASDETGDVVLTYFRAQPGYVEKLLPVGAKRYVSGTAQMFDGTLQIVHPDRVVDEAGLAKLTGIDPVYPLTEGLALVSLRRAVAQALQKLPELPDWISPEILRRCDFPSWADALHRVHVPKELTDILPEGPFWSRLAFDELLAGQLALALVRAQLRRPAGSRHAGDGHLRSKIIDALPYALTASQQQAASAISEDLRQPIRMLRLLQGDVGSGKTVVAALAALHAIANGRQTALMAPTELLAEQHLRSFRAWLEPLGIEVVWLAGKVTGRARTAALGKLAAGAPVAVGTHALMQEGVEFARLGLAIVDEQHRFGVQQRMNLRDKGAGSGEVPHQLVLTATPIPRTLAMSAYADLDVSTLDELPPGRTPVRTVAIANTRRDEVVERIRAACAEGRQAYWVCTLIEDSDVLQAQAAEVAYAQLCAALPELTVGLVHGRMKPKEKQAAMDAFKDGHTALLVATTVIEVGVDVPNASLMVIENAERLGLAQLHQLRGRVGRGSVASTCVLLYQPPLSGLAKQRLETLRQTNDGFVIAEQDLRLRGPGELLGTRQTGEMGFRVADIVRDASLMPAVQRVGTAMLRHPPLARRLVERWIGAAARFAEA